MAAKPDSGLAASLVNASREAGVVVVGTRGREAFEGMSLGSVSHAVFDGGACAAVVIGADRE